MRVCFPFPLGVVCIRPDYFAVCCVLVTLGTWGPVSLCWILALAANRAL